ncbi:hypothetical protein QX776_10485 [Alteromonadaceae bacterium BrNp21-10]|nr:hypothetical protein [Alteromonadaceae bacterium BrNp21-10]
MHWILIIVGILVIVGLFSNSNQKEQELNLVREAEQKAETKERTQKRVVAYADFLRRTAVEQVQGMSNNELYDLIERAIEKFAKDMDESMLVPRIIFSLCLILGVYTIFDGDEAGIKICAVGIVISIGLLSYAKKKVETKYINNGWDPARLKV